MEKLRTFFEPMVFGVCEYLGERFSIPSYRIRMFFIYATFLTFGSPIFVYLGLAFLLNLKDYIRSYRKSSIWDL